MGWLVVGVACAACLVAAVAAAAATLRFGLRLLTVRWAREARGGPPTG